MGTQTVERFEESLQGVADSCRRVAPSGVQDALAEVVIEPAVGVPLGPTFDELDVTLPESVVVDPSVAELDAAATGVTPAGLGIANYGTVTVQSRADGDELVSLYPKRHVSVLSADDVVPDMPAAFERLEEAFDAGTTTHVLETGPSATADMGSLVQGVHGPEQVHVVVVEPDA